MIYEESLIDFVRTFFLSLYSYVFCLKIIDARDKNNFKELFFILMSLVIIICAFQIMEQKLGIPDISFFIICILFSKRNKYSLVNSIVLAIVSLSINYVILISAIFIDFLINSIIEVNNKLINLSVIILVYSLIFFLFFKIKRLKRGIIFLKNKLENEYFNILLLNIGVLILFLIAIFLNYNVIKLRTIVIPLIISAGIMFITIQKSLQLYYKQRMLVKDLEETKEELENEKKEVKRLEKENLEFSKISHSISHKQKSLEYKLNELSMNSEIADEVNLKERIKNLNKDIKNKPVIVLDKTGIVEIDDMLKYMQAECLKNKIDFQLQLNGNIYTMINNYINKEKLEILLADHIKNAIIAIGYSKNVNKSILVRLGKLDRNYGLYIYDSGIEFEIETLLNLGKKPSTTHKDAGGTGMGFMNTFDTLKECKASFIIEEYGKPVKNNFTKALKFKFDNKHEFKIYSYRHEEIKNKDKENTLNVENLKN